MFELSLNKNSVRDWEDLHRHGAALSMARGSTNAVSASRRNTGLWLSRLLLTRARQHLAGVFQCHHPWLSWLTQFLFGFSSFYRNIYGVRKTMGLLLPWHSF